MIIQVNDQISLTEFRRRDIPRLVEYLADPDIYAMTLRIPKDYGTADAERWFEILKELEASPALNHHWAIRDQNGTLIGGIGLEGTALAPHRAELGYWLGKPFWGRGMMTDVVQTVCRRAFDHLGLSKLTAYVFACNDASASVLKKSGFRQEGFLPQHHLKDGRLVDAKIFGLTHGTLINSQTKVTRIKQVIVMRHDLGMRRGKQIAQGAHAAMSFLTERLTDSRAINWCDFPAEQQQWLDGGFAKVCCRVNSEEELMQIYERAMAAGLEVHLITDSGKTEFHGEPTRTCLAIGPANAEVIDVITGHLELL